MNMYELQEFSGGISMYLEEKYKEDKEVQIIDLKAFINCYDSTIKIIDCESSEINVIEHEGSQKKIIFCELKRVSDLLNYYETFYEIYNSKDDEINEFWCVFVEEFATNDFKQFINFIEENQMNVLFDKIFLFQFFKSTVHQLK